MFPAARQEGGTTPDCGREWRLPHVLPTTPWSISPCPFGFHPSPWTPPLMLVSRAVQCPLVCPGLAPGSRVGIDVRNVCRGPPLAAPLPFCCGHRWHQLTLPFAWFDSWTPPLGAHAFDSPPPLRSIPWTLPPLGSRGHPPLGVCLCVVDLEPRRGTEAMPFSVRGRSGASMPFVSSAFVSGTEGRGWHRCPGREGDALLGQGALRPPPSVLLGIDALGQGARRPCSVVILGHIDALWSSASMPLSSTGASRPGGGSGARSGPRQGLRSSAGRSLCPFAPWLPPLSIVSGLLWLGVRRIFRPLTQHKFSSFPLKAVVVSCSASCLARALLRGLQSGSWCSE